MARPRLALHQILTNLMDERGLVYFQPPNNTKLVYPCIVYNRLRSPVRHANNSPYRYTKQYQVTVIDRNVDSVIPDLVAALPMCTHNRWYASDNLNHDVFNLYF